MTSEHFDEEGVDYTELKNLEEVRMMCKHPGWNLLLQDLTYRIRLLSDSLLNKNVGIDELRLAQGKFELLKDLLILEEQLDEFFKQQQEGKVENPYDPEAV